MRRRSEKPLRALVVVVALAAAVSACDSDGIGGAVAPTEPSRTEQGASRALSGAGAGADSRALDPTTSAQMANPFSTFMQGPTRDAAPAGPSNESRPLSFAVAGTRVDGGQTVVILAQEGRRIAVRDIGVLDEFYEVEAIDERQIVLLHLPSMSRQVLALGPARGRVAAPAALPDEPEPEN
jgi:hypothetical protein